MLANNNQVKEYDFIIGVCYLVENKFAEALPFFESCIAQQSLDTFQFAFASVVYCAYCRIMTGNVQSGIELVSRNTIQKKEINAAPCKIWTRDVDKYYKLVQENM